MRYKIKRSTFAILIFLIFFLSIGMASASHNALSNSTGDDILANSSGGSNYKYFEDVQTQIDNAQEGDEIILEGSSYTSLNGSHYEIPINVNKSITLVGIENKTIFDARGQSGMISVSGANHFVIKDITFINSLDLGAVYCFNSNVDVINCVFDLNQGVMGAGLSIISEETDTTINIINCTFKNNCLSEPNGGVGGSFLISTFDCRLVVNINNSLFRNNVASKAGNIYCGGDEKKFSCLNINNCTFDSNGVIHANVGGYKDMGASDIFVDKSSNFVLNITGSNFIRPQEMDIDSDIDLSIISSANEVYMSDTNFTNNILSFEKSNIHVNNCNFKNTSARLFVNPDEDYSYSDFGIPRCEDLTYHIIDSSFDNSTIVLGKGSIINSTFTNSSLVYKNSQKYLLIDNCIFNNHSLIHSLLGLNVSDTSFTNGSNIRISKLQSEARLSKISQTTYDSGKKLVITVEDQFSKEFINGLTLKVKVFSASKSKTYTVTTDKYGKARFALDTRLAVGSHKIEITASDLNYALDKITTSVKVTKAKTTISAPKVTNKLKASKYFKVTVKNKATKKVVKNTKVKIKVDKKVFTVKTNSKGVAQINTKSLGVGVHKVVISSGNSNYEMSAKSTIVIKR